MTKLYRSGLKPQASELKEGNVMENCKCCSPHRPRRRSSSHLIYPPHIRRLTGWLGCHEKAHLWHILMFCSKITAYLRYLGPTQHPETTCNSNTLHWTAFGVYPCWGVRASLLMFDLVERDEGKRISWDKKKCRYVSPLSEQKNRINGQETYQFMPIN